MKTDKIKGLNLYTEKVGSLTYLRCELDSGEKINFPHSISPIREIFGKVVDIMSEVSWEGVTKETVTKKHWEVANKASREMSKV